MTTSASASGHVVTLATLTCAHANASRALPWRGAAC